MGKSGKTFTIDIKILDWLEDYAKKQKKKESAIINSMLKSAKRQDESWTCSICGVSNANASTSCYTLTDGVFCEGVKA